MSFVQSKSNGTTASVSSITVTLTSPVTSGNCVWGSATFDSATGSTPTITDDKGTTYPIKDTVTDTTGQQTIVSFVLGNITNGPKTFTLSLSPASDFVGLIVVEESGILAVSDPTDGHTGQFILPGTGTNALTSGTFTTTVNGDTICGSATESRSNATVSAAGTSPVTFTLREGPVTGFGEYYAEDGIQTTASASTAATFTASGGGTPGGGWIVVAMALKPAPAGDTLANHCRIFFI